MEDRFGKRLEEVVGATFQTEGAKVRFQSARMPDERPPTGRRSQLKVAVGSDHRGYQLKQRIIEYLYELGHLVVDCGIQEDQPADYPDLALSVGGKVVRKVCDFGILIDAVGVGSAVAANKIKGIRAATCHDVDSARSSRLHNDANILCLGSGFVNRGLARRMVRIWLETPFEGGRHTKRIEKITKIEQEGLDARL
jgi:ribose 5-phosphate isomerase B